MLEIIPNWHPIFVHFTVTFISVMAVLQLVIWLRPQSEHMVSMLLVQKVLMIITSVSVLVTLFTGFGAYNSVAHDTPSHMAMTDHKNWAFTTASVFLLAAILYFVKADWRKSVVGILLIASGALVAVTGFKGGELVYRYGLGVMSLPQVSASADGSGDGHDHEHGAPAKGANTMEEDSHNSHGAEVEVTSKPHINDSHGHGAKVEMAPEPKPHLNDGHAH